ncbi:MAG TPA: hypothetical protein VKV16_07395 [Solirubrobacteraceae bacterium]|nr:hypothetical protein [Solirubrobacteraceae bacterium]
MPTRTTTPPPAELLAALAMAGKPQPAPAMPPVDLRLRLLTSPRLRGLLPGRLAIARAARRGRAAWEHDDAQRERALAMMRAIVAGTAREAQTSALARERVIEAHVDRTLFWRPWRAPLLDAQASARLRAAFSEERGVLLSTCHVGPYYRNATAFARLGEPPYAVLGPWFFEPPSSDYWGRRLARWWQGARSMVVCSKGSFALLQALLEHGKAVYLFFDMPGARRTRFLGKPAMLADGTARLAVAADVPVLPVRSRRVGHRVRMDVAAALDPRELGGVQELHQALAAQHERWILELPAAMDDPAAFGWGACATARAWERPERS